MACSLAMVGLNQAWLEGGVDRSMLVMSSRLDLDPVTGLLWEMGKDLSLNEVLATVAAS